jgi:transposase
MVRRVRVEGDSVTRAARAFGFSRQWFYELASAFDTGGLAALVAARPGPHTLSKEVVGFARERLAADPSLRSADLAEAIWARFGIRMHPDSVARALRRADRLEVEAADELGDLWGPFDE